MPAALRAQGESTYGENESVFCRVNFDDKEAGRDRAAPTWLDPRQRLWLDVAAFPLSHYSVASLYQIQLEVSSKG
jgi:hypothetical protein